MKKTVLLLAITILAAISAAAKDKAVMPGTIISENSVSCGSEAKGKKQTIEMMCQEYVIRTDTTEYHVRQEKEAHKGMLPVNASVELTMNKDKMKFKVNGKEYEMLIVSESAAPPGTPAAAAPATPGSAATPKR
jgi:predicted P-loop ATPase